MDLGKLDLQQLITPTGTVIAANEAITADAPFGAFVAAASGSCQILIMASASVRLMLTALGQTGYIDDGYAFGPDAWQAFDFHVVLGQVYAFSITADATVSASLVYSPLLT